VTEDQFKAKQITAGALVARKSSRTPVVRARRYFLATTSGSMGSAHNANFILGAKILCGLFVSPPHAWQAPKAEPFS
jgi:hypothetical protein